MYMKKLYLIILSFVFPLVSFAITKDTPEIEMIYVKGGTFSMGSNPDETEHAYETPRHEVTLHDYRIGKYEVTQELWETVMGDNPSVFKGKSRPVENVSWNDVNLFIKKLNKVTGRHYRLPTEAEWEFAARGGNESNEFVFIGGDEIDKIAWHFGNSEKQTHQVGLLAPNELGIYDMAGNVSEWTQDWFGHYKAESQTNPKGPKSSDIGKIFRGGHYSILSEYNRPAWRSVSNPNFRSSTIGFRLAE